MIHNPINTTTPPLAQSMLRPSGSYPRACPYWMHAPTSQTNSPTSLSHMSPLATTASLFNRGRHCSTLYDYGFSE